MRQITLFVFALFFVPFISFSQSIRRNLADVNGDGKNDKIEYKEYPQNFVDIIVSFGTSNGNYGAPFTFISRIDRGYPDKPWGFADVNDDGKADFLTFRGGGKKDNGTYHPIVQWTYFSTGNTLNVENKTETEFEGVPALVVPPTMKITGRLDPTNHDPDRNYKRGMPSYMYCGDSPESWVRGNATLDQASGILFITIQLETDAIYAGPKGQVTVILKDCNGKSLVNATTDEIATGGKGIGSVSIRNFSSRIKIDSKIARKVCSMNVTAQCTGSYDRILNIKLSTIGDAFSIGVKYLSGL